MVSTQRDHGTGRIPRTEHRRSARRVRRRSVANLSGGDSESSGGPRTPLARDPLLRAAADPSRLIRTIAAGSLRYYDDTEVRDRLAQLAHDVDDAVARRAIKSLGYGGDSNVERLVAIVRSGGSKRSAIAARELGRIGSADARALIDGDVEALKRFDQAFDATHRELPGIRAMLVRALYRHS